MKEEERIPPFKNIVPYKGRPSYNQGFCHPDEVVGLYMEKDNKGYCRKVASTGSPDFFIDSADDACRWLSTKDSRFTFVRGKRAEIDSILKWFGQLTTIPGYPARIRNLDVRYKNDYLTVQIAGGRNTRRISSLVHFYHMSGLLAEDEDCYSVKEKAQRLINLLFDNDIPFTGLPSPGIFFRSLLSQYGVKISSHWGIPERALMFAYDCYHTNWVEAFKLGYFPKVTDVDIVLAYPTETMNLMSCNKRYGDWTQSNKPINTAEYGFCYVTVFIPPDLIHPMLVRHLNWRGIRQMNPNGEFTGFMTADELQFLKDFGCSAVIHEGWWFIPKYEVYPFEPAMKRLKDFSEEAERRNDKFARNLAKLTGSSAQGQFIATRKLYGKLRPDVNAQFVYAATITARTRVKLARAIQPYSDRLLHVAVDGATIEGDVVLLGGLKSQGEGECIVAGDGAYWMKERLPTQYLKESLEHFSDQDFYIEPLATTYHGINSPEFDKVGLPIPFPHRRWTMKQLRSDCGRYFNVLPKECGELTCKQFESQARLVH